MATNMGARFQRETLPPAYDKYLVPKIFEPWARLLVDFVGLRLGETVLDVATGPGTVARVAAERVGSGGRVVGIDQSQPMLAVARGKPQAEGMASIEYVECPATELRVPDAAFDVALCQQGLQFFPDRQCALTEIRRALRPGGRVGIAVWAGGSPNFSGTREALIGCGVDMEEGPRFGQGPSDLPDALTNAGFRVDRSEDVTLTITYEGGIDEVIEHIAAYPHGPAYAALPIEKHVQFKRLLADKLRRWMSDGVLRTPMIARVAMATKPI